MNLHEFPPVLISVVNAVLMVFLPTLAVTLIVALVGFIKKEWALFKAAQPTVADQLAMYARIAVEAAQQAGAAGLIASKKDYALEITTRWLDQNGLSGLDVELIEAEIERQVRDMKLNAPALTATK
jgi:hypothetical protein